MEPRNESADIWSLGCVFLEMITVLRGERVASMRERFYKETENYFFHSNERGVEIWISYLWKIGESSDSGDSLALRWTRQMLEQTASKRPTAARVLELIVEDCEKSGAVFSGTCCHDDGEGSDGDSSGEDEEGRHWVGDSHR